MAGTLFAPERARSEPRTAMSLLPPRRRATAFLVLAIAATVIQAGCDRKPTDPPRPSDPDRSMPRPITAAPAASAASQ